MSDDLRIDDDITLPASELEWRFETSGGPGGQHANRSATRAVLSYDLGLSRVFDDDEKQRIANQLGSRVRDGVVVVAVDDSRSQWRNRQMARAKLRDMLRDARRPAKRRRPTRPSGGSVRRRIENKRRRSEVKKLRRPPDF